MKFAPGTRDSITGKPYFYKSECGNYTVTIPADEAGGQRYLAFAREKDRRGIQSFVMQGGYPNARLAKEACETHQKEHAVVDQAA